MLKKIIQNFIIAIQRILMTVLLTIVYFICFTVTWLFVILVKGRKSAEYRKKSTFWIEAEGYVADMADSIRQS